MMHLEFDSIRELQAFLDWCLTYGAPAADADDDPGDADPRETVPGEKLFTERICTKCMRKFTPRGGNQKFCDACRKDV